MIRLTLPLLMLPTLSAAQSACICLACIGTTLDRYGVVSEDMKPTFTPDQCLIFDSAARPRPGDVVTFLHRGQTWMKRLIATEGQTVQMIDGRLFIDGTAVPTERMDEYLQDMAPEGPHGQHPMCPRDHEVGDTCVLPRFRETLGSISYDVLDSQVSRMDNTPLMTVPPGHVFVLGDHRDNSVDSRLPVANMGVGFVPVENITGVFESVNE